MSVCVGAGGLLGDGLISLVLLGCLQEAAGILAPAVIRKGVQLIPKTNRA